MCYESTLIKGIFVFFEAVKYLVGNVNILFTDSAVPLILELKMNVWAIVCKWIQYGHWATGLTHANNIIHCLLKVTHWQGKQPWLSIYNQCFCHLYLTSFTTADINHIIWLISYVGQIHFIKLNKWKGFWNVVLVKKMGNTAATEIEQR